MVAFSLTACSSVNVGTANGLLTHQTAWVTWSVEFLLISSPACSLGNWELFSSARSGPGKGNVNLLAIDNKSPARI